VVPWQKIIVTFPDGTGSNNVEDSIQCADLALYRSKSTGRNTVTHYADMDVLTVGPPAYLK
jgi:hypothetical protein